MNDETPEILPPRLSDLDAPPRFRGSARFVAPGLVQGWVFDTQAPDSAVPLQLSVDDTVLAELSPTLERPDLAPAYGRPLRAGFAHALKAPTTSRAARLLLEARRGAGQERPFALRLRLAHGGALLRINGQPKLELDETAYIEAFALQQRQAERGWLEDTPKAAASPIASLWSGEGEVHPGRTSPLPPSPWLVFAPHADDEAIGLGGSLLRATEAGFEVHVVIVTDGAQGGEAAQRRAEAQAYAVAAGLTSLEILDASDRGLEASPATIARFGALMRRHRPRSIFAPGAFEAHPDHRACLQAAWSAAREQAPEAAFFGYEITAQSPANAGFDIDATAQRKYALLSQYASQTGQRDYVGLARALDQARAYGFADGVQHVEGVFRFEQRAAPTPLPEVERWMRRRFGQDEPLVSVIVRTYNRPQLLTQAIACLRRQQLRNIELVVVNDGGVDVAEQVVAGEALVRCRYVALPENCGRAAAANAGLAAASGELLAFLDDDDLIEPDHLQRLTLALLQQPAAVAAYSGVRMVPKPDDFRSEYWQDPFDRALLLQRNLFAIHAVLFRRRALDYGCRFDERLPATEDWDFWLQLSRIGDFVPVRHCSAIYRQLGDSGGGLWQTGVEPALAQRIQAVFAEKWLRPQPGVELLLDEGFSFEADRALRLPVQAGGEIAFEMDLSDRARLRSLRVVALAPANAIDCRLVCVDTDAGQPLHGHARPAHEYVRQGTLRLYRDAPAAVTFDFADGPQRPVRLRLQLQVHALPPAVIAALPVTAPLSTALSDIAALQDEMQQLRDRNLGLQQELLAMQRARSS